MSNDHEGTNSTWEQLILRQEEAWSRGEPIEVEGLLSGDQSQRPSDEQWLELIYREVCLREAYGQTVRPSEYVDRFPRIAERIKRIFELHSALIDPANDLSKIVDASRLPIGPTDVTALLPGTPKVDSAAKSLANPLEETALVSPATTAPRRIAPGESFGEYEIEEEIARGGMGVVFRARHRRLNRIVALKMIKAAELANSEEVSRFQAEAEAAAQLDHPNIVPVFEVGQLQGQHYFSMGFVEGESLAQRIKEGPLPPSEAAEVTRVVSEAIGYAHRRGVIHRDLKPANILLAVDATALSHARLSSSTNTSSTPQLSRPLSVHASVKSPIGYTPKVTDFGLAKMMEEDQGITATGQILGTPPYMPPEQASGKISEVTETADIYSLGAILYCLLVGRPPFQAATSMDTLLQVLKSDPIPPRQVNSAIPRDLETICLKCLEKDRRKRYPAATDLADELQRYLNGEPIHARPVSRIEQGWRWCSRNPVVATLSTTAALLLVIGTIVSSYFAIQAHREAGNAVSQAKIAGGKAEDARIAEALAKERLEQVKAANAETEQALFRLNTSFGLTYAQQNQPRDAMLWFANAARIARPDSSQARASLARLNTWRNAMPTPRRMLWHDGEELRETILNPQGLQIATLTHQRRCTIWDPLKNESHIVSKEAFAIDWSPAGSLLAVGVSQGDVLLIDSHTMKIEKTISLNDGSDDPITAVRFSPDGSQIALASKVVRVWDTERIEFITPPLSHPKSVQSVCFSSSDSLISTACEDGRARLFRLDGNDAEPVLEPLTHMLRIWPEQPPYDPYFVAEGRYVATMPRSNCTDLIDVKTGQVALTIRSQSPSITRRRVSPDGRLLALASSDAAQLWDCQTLSKIGSVDADLRILAIRPDQEELLLAAENGTVRHWSIVTDQSPPESITPEWTGMQDIAYSFDGKRFATSFLDGTVCLWEMAPNDAARRNIALSGGGSAIKLSRDGQYLLPTGAGWFWGNLRQTQLYSAADLAPQGQQVTANALLIDCDLSSDNQTLAAASYNAIEFWNWRTGERAAPTIPLDVEPLAIGFPAGSNNLIVVHADASISKFNSETAEPVFAAIHGERRDVPFIRYGTTNHRYQDAASRAAGYPRTTRSLLFSDDGKWFVSGGLNDAVNVWSVSDGSLRYSPLAHDELAKATQLSTDNRYLATASGHKASVWDFATGERISPALAHPSEVNHAVFSPQGDQLLTLTDDGTALLWNWRKGTVDIPPLNHEKPIYDGEFVSDGEWIMTASGKSAKFWSRHTGRIVAPAVTLDNNRNTRVLLSRDGKWAFVSGGANSNPATRDAPGRTIAAISLQNLDIQPDDELVADFGVCAELFSNKRIEDGVAVPLNGHEWRARFNELTARRPAWFEPLAVAE